MRALFVLAFVTAALCSISAAQDYSQQPIMEGPWSSGFTPDPLVVNVLAGGDVDASETVSPSCAGFYDQSPSYAFDWQARPESDLPLIFSVNSDTDTTLLINAPDGTWYCDDDGGVHGLNPSMRFNSPQSGRYDIWVGLFARGEPQPAFLNISELTSQ